jgi:hypothetical protein
MCSSSREKSLKADTFHSMAGKVDRTKRCWFEVFGVSLDSLLVRLAVKVNYLQKEMR